MTTCKHENEHSFSDQQPTTWEYFMVDRNYRLFPPDVYGILLRNSDIYRRRRGKEQAMLTKSRWIKGIANIRN